MDIVIAFLGVLFVLAAQFIQLAYLMSDVSRLEEVVSALEKKVFGTEKSVPVGNVLPECSRCREVDDD